MKDHNIIPCMGCTVRPGISRDCCPHTPLLCDGCFEAHNATHHHAGAHPAAAPWRSDERFQAVLEEDPIAGDVFGPEQLEHVMGIAYRFWQLGLDDQERELQRGAAAELDDEVLIQELAERSERAAKEGDAEHHEQVLDLVNSLMALARAQQIDGAIVLLHYPIGRQAFLMRGIDSFNVTKLVTMMNGLSMNLSAQWMNREVHGAPEPPSFLRSVPDEDE